MRNVKLAKSAPWPSAIVRITMLCAGLFTMLAAPGCGPEKSSGGAGPSADGGLSGKLILTGSSTIAPLAAEIGKRFESLHPGVRVDVQTGGSGRGIADARSGAADIGMVSRSLQDEEADLIPFTIARDGVTMIVQRDNPVQALTDAQILAIYTGKIRNWQQVGGRDAPITVVNKAEGRATLEVFLHHFQLDNRQIRADVIIGDNEQGIKTVAGNRDALGYVSIGTAAADARSGVPIRLLPIGGVTATTAHVADGSFKMSRSLNLVTSQPPVGLAKAFLDFARSDRVHDLVVAQHFVPLSL